MNHLLDLDFLDALLRSPTFFREVGQYVALCVICAVVALGLLARGLGARGTRGLRALHRETQGGAMMLDFTLVAPIFMIVVMLLLQFAVLANGTLLVHYAAYVAARTARVHAWIYPDDNPILGIGLAQVDHRPIPNTEHIPSVDYTVEEAADHAARLALIAASPGARRIPKPAPVPGLGAPVPEAILQAVARAEPSFRGNDARTQRANTLIERARFAFSPENAQVEITYPTFDRSSTPARGGNAYEALVEGADHAGLMPECTPEFGCVESEFLIPGVHDPGTPVTATVKFRLRLAFPIAARMWCAAAHCERIGNHYFRVATAKVTLL